MHCEFVCSHHLGGNSIIHVWDVKDPPVVEQIKLTDLMKVDDDQ